MLARMRTPATNGFGSEAAPPRRWGRLVVSRGQTGAAHGQKRPVGL